jgi:hypothetical protein
MPSNKVLNWLRGWDLNPRPSGYEPDELPGCSTPRFCSNRKVALFRERATQFVKFLYGFGHFVRMDKVTSIDDESSWPQVPPASERQSGRLAYNPQTLQILGAREHHQISDRHILRPS